MKYVLIIGLLLIGHSSFSGINKDSVIYDISEKKHSIYGELWSLGKFATIGYSYEFLRRNRFDLSLSLGVGGRYDFDNPATAFVFPVGIESKFRFKNRFSLLGGVFNYYYVNYWANFTDEGKDCSGLWICPPDISPVNIIPFLGTSYDWKKFVFSARVYSNIYGFWNAFPVPSLNIKLRL